ncbi:MAG: putative lactoylglutathione lyase [Bacteroidetes bacterium]|jgi:predicted enzyme related to lactoylglutathione lyase|nr:putative lactoylglutathione lyase [Bacteroidota bacterium]MDF2450596.1 putative lactoylglutathione lyase [Bacteroidota bacterium]
MGKQSMIILYVSDQERSRSFYQMILKQDPLLDVPGMTEFTLTTDFKLGLMPEKGIAKILCPHSPDPALGNGIPRCELYLKVNDPAEALNKAISAGAKEISKAELRNWGDTVSYCSDPDGHILAFFK